MSNRQWMSIVLVSCGALVGSLAMAQAPEEQACMKTRAEVKKECVDFMKTHTWDEGSSNYVLKAGVKTPEGVMTREEVKAERDKFFRTHRWNAAQEKWEAIGAPRDVSKLTRAQVRAETAAFLKTHRWDEASSSYVDVKTRK